MVSAETIAAADPSSRFGGKHGPSCCNTVCVLLLLLLQLDFSLRLFGKNLVIDANLVGISLPKENEQTQA